MKQNWTIGLILKERVMVSKSNCKCNDTKTQSKAKSWTVSGYRERAPPELI